MQGFCCQELDLHWSSLVDSIFLLFRVTITLNKNNNNNNNLGHHAVTCKYSGDVVTRHNMIRDILVETCRRAHIGVKVEVGNNLRRDHSKTRPADILLPNWFLGRTAALDVSITSPLNPVSLLEAGVSATAAAQATESRKHHANDPKCSDLGWVCVPMVVETYGAWGKEATAIISSVAS